MKTFRKYFTILLIIGSILLSPQLAKAEEGLLDGLFNIFNGSSSSEPNIINGTKDLVCFKFEDIYRLSNDHIATLEALKIPDNIKDDYRKAIESLVSSENCTIGYIRRRNNYLRTLTPYERQNVYGDYKEYAEHFDLIHYQNKLIDSIIELHNFLQEYATACKKNST